MAASQPERNACRVSSGHKSDPEAVRDVMHHYPFHASDYMMSTAHLTLEEDATYRRLLDFYYTTELPIPTDNRAVSRRLRVDEKITASVLAEFFVPQDDGWHNERCDAEIAAYHAMKERNALNGKLGGRPLKTDRLPRANRGVSQNNPLVTDSKANQEPITNNHISPLPPSGETKAKSVRGTRLPENWGLDPNHETGLTEEVRDAARSLKTELGSDWTSGTVRYHLNEFRNHFHASSQRNAVKLDWLAAWRNWCSKAMREMPSADPVRRDRQAAAARQAEAAAT